VRSWARMEVNENAGDLTDRISAARALRGSRRAAYKIKHKGAAADAVSAPSSAANAG